jgi:hypothetical protein
MFLSLSWTQIRCNSHNALCYRRCVIQTWLIHNLYPLTNPKTHVSELDPTFLFRVQVADPGLMDINNQRCSKARREIPVSGRLFLFLSESLYGP